MIKRVYKYTSVNYGISNLENKRLKVSTMKDLNDPFDLCPLDTTNPVISEAVGIITRDFWSRTGMLCFSRNWDNLLLWSHYGASHAGVCLGFDVPSGDTGSNFQADVLYQPNLLQLDKPEDVNLNLADRLYRTKHECWSYEQEVRMFVALNDAADSNDLHWINFGSDLVLREVIIGAQCEPRESVRVQEAVQAFCNDVRCWWAGMRPDAFLLVRQDRPPYWHAQLKK